MTPLTLLVTERIAGQAARDFGEKDPGGLAMSIIAMGVIFLALILLLVAFRYIARLYSSDIRKRLHRNRPLEDHPENEEPVSGETLAAISLALHLYQQQVQGLEDAVITFKKAAKTYSPWSSKIYGLRRLPK
jgi:glutaconyl-CoA/methylmalonyl-CoA decarboxylase subunit delta